MPTPRETILTALLARLSALPERVSVAGRLILRDGEPGEPEVTLSPLRYHYRHSAEIKAVVQGADRDAAFDTLTASIGAAVVAGGRVALQDRARQGHCTDLPAGAAGQTAEAA